MAGAIDVPVAAGASGPLSGEAELGNYVHGASGLDGPTLPPPAFDPDPRGAVPLMLEVLTHADHPVTLVCTDQSPTWRSCYGTIQRFMTGSRRSSPWEAPPAAETTHRMRSSTSTPTRWLSTWF